jgi:hypothetical protein
VAWYVVVCCSTVWRDAVVWCCSDVAVLQWCGVCAGVACMWWCGDVMVWRDTVVGWAKCGVVVGRGVMQRRVVWCCSGMWCGVMQWCGAVGA